MGTKSEKTKIASGMRIGSKLPLNPMVFLLCSVFQKQMGLGFKEERLKKGAE